LRFEFEANFFRIETGVEFKAAKSFRIETGGNKVS
jgi:hypothetical protein